MSGGQISYASTNQESFLSEPESVHLRRTHHAIDESNVCNWRCFESIVYSETISLEGSRQEETPGTYDVLLRMLAVSLSYRDLANARGHYHIAVTSALIWQRAH